MKSNNRKNIALLIGILLFCQLFFVNFVIQAYANDPNPFLNEKFYVDPNSRAKQQADIWRTSRPSDAQIMEKLAQSPSHAMWFGNWSGEIEPAVNSYVTKVKNANALPILVIYNIPQRDCGLYSAGGSNSPESYREWIKAFTRGLANRKAVIILEPDALGVMECLSDSDKEIRKNLLNEAVQTLTVNPNAKVYIDISHWLPVQEAANRLSSAGINSAQGFVINVSNFEYTNSMINFGKNLSPLVGNKSFIIDTSRNGLGPWREGGTEKWCNPPGRAIGDLPTTNTAHSLVDAYVWVKAAGESDGTCQGGPSAGIWWPDYALGLVQRSSVLSSSTPSPSPAPTSLHTYSQSLSPYLPTIFTVHATPSAPSITPGDKLSFTLSLKSSHNQSVLIDAEIFDNTGTKVFQKFFDNQHLQNGITHNLLVSWETENTIKPGYYSIKAGIFNPNWQGLLYWNDSIETVVISDQTSPDPVFLENVVKLYGKINIFDYNQLVSEFGNTGTNLKSDINKSGKSLNKVDILDFNTLLSNTNNVKK